MKGFKTFVLGIATILLSLLAGLQNSPEASQLIAEYAPWVGGIIGVLIVVLRAITTSPIFKSE